MFEKLKPGVEIIAIVLGGAFVFFTWGIDAIQERSPSWHIFIDDVTELRLRAHPADNTQLQSCLDMTKCETRSCQYQGTVKFKNTGLRPLSMNLTKIELFTVKKSKNETSDSFKNITPYYLYAQLCKTNDKECEVLQYGQNIEISGTDDSPLFPGEEAWRPFSIDINKGVETEKFLRENGLLIRATQKFSFFDQLYFWEVSNDESVTLFYDPGVCSFSQELKALS